jgi:hypothetical protein
MTEHVDHLLPVFAGFYRSKNFLDRPDRTGLKILDRLQLCYTVSFVDDCLFSDIFQNRIQKEVIDDAQIEFSRGSSKS